MAEITFYEKPGCQNNRKQKEWLELAGHSIEVIDLIGHSWQKEELRKFFGGKPVPECFNLAAPDVRDGKLDPSAFSEDEALELMIGNPLLIRRPLMIIDGRYLQGFETQVLRKIISLEPVRGAETVVESLKMLDLNTCPNPASDICNTIKEN
ncbi:MAG: arsenate reductase family protein [Chlorobiales bacterium]|nr:arsenate reductase family protein [Chlorobiales bacterium]